MQKILSTYVIQNQYLKQVASVQHNTTHCTPTRPKACCPCTAQHNTTHCTPTRPETGRQCTAQHNTLYTYKTRDRSPVHSTTHTLYTYKTRDRSPVHSTTQHIVHLQDPRQVASAQHNTTHCTPTRPETGRQCIAQHTHCTPTRPETGRQCTAQHNTLYTYKTRDRSPVHSTTHCTPTRPETGRQCTAQHIVHLQDPRQVASAQHNTLYTYKTRDRSPVHSTTHTLYTYKTRDRSPVHSTTQHIVHLQDPRQVASAQHNTTHCTPTRPKTGRQCIAQHTHCTPTRPETGRQCTAQHNTLYTYKTRDRSPVHSTTQHIVHLQDPRQVASA